MNPSLSAVGILFASLLVPQILFAQGATQAVRGAAQGLQGQVDGKQRPLTGPTDSQEKVAPGKVDDNVSSEFVTTASGLKYRILRRSGGKKPTVRDNVEVHYKGWLDDDTIFDSSYRKGKTSSFGLTQVVKGWTQGLQLVGVDGMIELYVPYQLAYGEKGRGPIPPKANLHFIIELLSIN